MSPKTDLISPLPYFGPAGYYSLALHHGSILFDLGDHYVKRSYRNRCRILGSNGVLNLSVPVKKPSGKVPMKDVTIDYSKHWAHQHWHSIKSAYGSAPFFDHFSGDLAKLLNSRFDSLVELNLATHHFVEFCLGERIPYELSNEYVDRSLPVDLRTEFKGSSSLLGKAAPKGYVQVFADRFKFEPNLSILDLVFNEGPLALDRLKGDLSE